ncbi:hypothetical protein AVEN_104657-1 [Araneus ventricosus]|uniref:Uncharacterized protein n=1 Tax=Araneus ventricosus TaxID=182803 RepID=A0A4Y2BBN0_ARAVE|nr:hypothetical protein AVEN_104657-1 [Araneus ventricosus]
MSHLYSSGGEETQEPSHCRNGPLGIRKFSRWSPRSTIVKWSERKAELHPLRNLTLEEDLLVFNELNSDSDLEDIYIEPPDVAVVSDEDSAEEDKGGLRDNFSGPQLCVNVEMSRKKTHRKDYLGSEDEGLANSVTKKK